MAMIGGEGRADRSVLPNMRCIIDYGPDCLPVSVDWQLLPDFRLHDDPRTACVRVTVVRPDSGPLAVRVAALGLTRLGVRPADLVRAVMDLIQDGHAALPDREAA
jgi:hypothetical protein